MLQIVENEVKRLRKEIAKIKALKQTICTIPADETLVEAIGVLQDEGYNVGFWNDKDKNYYTIHLD